jgi:short-subunit dehydrogenase
MADRELNGKVVVITGASSGFGKGAALEFAAGGANLVLAARRKALLEELARECESAGGKALAVATDVSVPEQVELLAGKAVSHFGRIDVWVNNAGAATLGRFEDIPLDEHVEVVNTDLLGTLYGCYYAMRQLRSQQSGVIINVASAIGNAPSPYYSSYAAAKHGVVGMSAVLREELRAGGIDGIRVCTVLTATVDTPFLDYAGIEVTPAPLQYDPRDTIDAIVRLAKAPEDEVTVGPAGALEAFARQNMPAVMTKNAPRGSDCS